MGATGPEAIGPAGAIHVGDQVIAYHRRVPGAYATEVTWPADAVVPKPAALGWEQASGLLLAGASAVHALAATAVGDGDTVLIHGVSGGVGLTAAQLAWSELVSLAADGKLEVVVARTFPLADAAAAHKLVATGHAGGKVVLLP